jgi:hypothetical protein
MIQFLFFSSGVISLPGEFTDPSFRDGYLSSRTLISLAMRLQRGRAQVAGDVANVVAAALFHRCL